jgi:hypothetical protein
MKKKKLIILAILAFALAGGGWYAYSEYSRKVKDLANVKADLRINATELVAAFEKNETGANTIYLDKVIAVRGTVKSVEKNDRGHYTVILGESGSASAVRCSMDSTHQQDISVIPAGSLVTIKGACTGFNADELLGSDVILNRCVLDK